MIKLPKKIANAIERELGTDYTVIKYVYIKSIFKQLCVYLVIFRVGQSKFVNILRYFGNNSYCILGGYSNDKEVAEELAFQVEKLY